MLGSYQVAVQTPVVRWYRVVAEGQGGVDVRQNVQASSPDAALRQVMCLHSLRFTSDAFIWRLFSHVKPSRRCHVRCRLHRSF
ncbi:MAG: hypothetical protein ACYDER_25590 [Ktedonobacteraceae bacterium]